MNRSRLVWFALVVVAIVSAGGVWLKAQPRTITGQFDSVGADPAYIVVSTSTPVLFTAKITDRQLKKRSVVLLRLDSAGKPSNILGRLRDDGRNGDIAAGDSIYSFRTALNEPTVGAVNFQIAARFKPGRWSEPEADDDDWDRELTTLDQTGRDRPARQERLSGLIRRLSRYTLSSPIVVTVDPFKLPPDPGEAGKQTLAGIDSDGDGIRDDVQRWIASVSLTDTQKRRALSQLARIHQALIVSLGDRTALASLDSARVRAHDCIESFWGPSGLAAAVGDLKAQTLNTRERAIAYSRANTALGATSRFLTAEGSLRAGCDF
jgi:hypothetical protein